jgi:circadian clock protein KaiB
MIARRLNACLAGARSVSVIISPNYCNQRACIRHGLRVALTLCSSSAQMRVEAVLSKYILTLYVTGTSPRTKVAIDNLNRICAQELDGRYELEIVDVLEHPQRAEDEKILATPTLIKQLPLPLRRVIGDLSDKGKVLLGLEVRPNGDSSPSSSSTTRREAS